MSFPSDLFASGVVEPDAPVPDELFTRILIELKGHDPEVLNSYVTFCQMTANELGVKFDEKFANSQH